MFSFSLVQRIGHDTETSVVHGVVVPDIFVKHRRDNRRVGNIHRHSRVKHIAARIREIFQFFDNNSDERIQLSPFGPQRDVHTSDGFHDHRHIGPVKGRTRAAGGLLGCHALMAPKPYPLPDINEDIPDVRRIGTRGRLRGHRRPGRAQPVNAFLAQGVDVRVQDRETANPFKEDVRAEPRGRRTVFFLQEFPVSHGKAVKIPAAAVRRDGLFDLRVAVGNDFTLRFPRNIISQ